LNELERQLLREEVGDAVPRLCLRTGGRFDAGRWWRSTRVWLCVVGNDLVMLAVGRRRYVARVPITECSGSHYNHATGEFIIQPSETLQFNRFRITTREALQLSETMNLQPADPSS